MNWRREVFDELGPGEACVPPGHESEEVRDRPHVQQHGAEIAVRQTVALRRSGGAILANGIPFVPLASAAIILSATLNPFAN